MVDVGLLLTFGHDGLLGPGLELAEVSLAISPAAVVMAQLFTTAPFYLRTAKAGFLAVNREAKEVAHRRRGRLAGVLVRHPAAGFSLSAGGPGADLGAGARRIQGHHAVCRVASGEDAHHDALYSALESDLAPVLALSAVMVLRVVRVLTASREQSA